MHRSANLSFADGLISVKIASGIWQALTGLIQSCLRKFWAPISRISSVSGRSTSRCRTGFPVTGDGSGCSTEPFKDVQHDSKHGLVHRGILREAKGCVIFPPDRFRFLQFYLFHVCRSTVRELG